MNGRNQSQGAAHQAVPFLSVPVFCLLLFLPSPAAAQQGALVVQRNLAELVDAAGTIVVGTIINARVQPHPDFEHIPTVLVTVQVEESLKGGASGVFVYRQAILDIREQFNTAGYKKGQQVLLLLPRPSQYGLSTPMGLGQGRFRLLQDRRGQRFAVNGFGNAGLFLEMRTQLRQRGIDLNPAEASLVDEHRRGAVALDDLKSLIRKLVERP